MRVWAILAMRHDLRAQWLRWQVARSFGTGAVDLLVDALLGSEHVFAPHSRTLQKTVDGGGPRLQQNWFPAKVFVGDTYCYFAGSKTAEQLTSTKIHGQE